MDFKYIVKIGKGILELRQIHQVLITLHILLQIVWFILRISHKYEIMSTLSKKSRILMLENKYAKKIII